MAHPDDLMQKALSVFPEATVGEDNEGQLIVYTGWYRDPDDEDNLYLKDDSDEIPEVFDMEKSLEAVPHEPVVSSTPLVDNAGTEARQEALGGAMILDVAEYFEEQADTAFLEGLVSRAIDEAWRQSDMTEMDQVTRKRFKHLIIGKALMMVAEDQFTMAAAVVGQ